MPRSRSWRALRHSLLVLVAVAASVIALAPAVASAAVTAYPSPLPDFAHPDRQHYPYYNPVNGRNSRPVLVIYEPFTEVPLPPGRDETWLANRVFGGFPSVASYFQVNSRGAVNLSRAAETGGVANNGVVVSPAGRRADWAARSAEANNRLALQRVDPVVNFAQFDRNGDRVIGPDELTILRFDVDPCDDGTRTGCGGAATRYTEGGATFDGMNLSGQPVGLANSTTNLISINHEMMHTAFGMNRDWYQYNFDGYDIMANTLAGIEFSEMVNSWHAMHLGWIRPTIVIRDGYYDVGDYSDTGQSYLLYDPSRTRATDHYLMVENRRHRAGSYDNDPNGDRGLNVWRIDETRYYEDAATAFPIKRIRPCEPTPTTSCPGNWYFAEFDPADANTPQRTVQVPWNDGTVSGVAIRAIHDSGPSQRVYFDVPGPGVLVDCYDAGQPNHRRVLDLYAGLTNEVHLPLMNTDDVGGRFNVTVTGLPLGWASTPESARWLDQHVQTQTSTFVTLPSGAEGQYSLTVTADSALLGVSSSCTFDVTVHPRPVSGYVWADQPTAASYTPNTLYQHNSSFGTNTVSRIGVGNYTVRFPGIGTRAGMAHAAAYGDANARCKVEFWNSLGPDEQVQVGCYNTTGTRVDATYTVDFVRPTGPAVPYAYLWADQPTSASYTPWPDYQTNSTGGTYTMQRTGVGSYTATLPGIGATGGVPIVTAYGSANAAHCKALSWTPAATSEQVAVRCFTPAGGRSRR